MKEEHHHHAADEDRVQHLSTDDWSDATSLCFAGHGVARYCARRGLDGAKAGGGAPAVAMGAALGSPGPPGDGEGSGLLNGGGNTPCGGFREVELTSTGRKPKSGSASPLQEKFSRVVSSCLPSQRDNGYSRVGLTDE